MAISPNTPPGTLVVSLHSGSDFYPPFDGGLIKGRVYVLGIIEPSIPIPSVFTCSLEEFPQNERFDIGCFEIAALPKSLTRILTDTPIDEKIKEPEPV